ncbi:MAG TPA: glycosyltransferase family 39 protein [Candidatus Saccharimonadales bacterium]|nr:glycosyltransferase family 39 protein [Candidatus Saccharimonadales bacterium]
MRKVAIPGLATLAVLRVPSLMEPHWYTDEAGYVNVARELLKGKILYAQTWNNKPPGMLWTIALEVKLFGSSEIGLHLLTLVSGMATIAAIVWAAGRLYTPRRALIAGVIAAVILGLPLVDAELALPESLMIAPLSWAGAIVLVRILRGDRSEAPRRIPRWPLAAGVLMAAAIAYQQTAVAETSAFCFAMLVAPKLLRRDAFVFAGTVAAITAAWLTAAIITAGAGTVAFALAGFYVDYTQEVLPASAVGGIVHFGLAFAAALLIAAGAIANRQRPRVDWVLALWAGATLVVTAVAGQPYPHFLAPAVAPLTLLVSGVSVPSRLRFRRGSRRSLIGPGLQIGGLTIAILTAKVAGIDWLPIPPSATNSHTLSDYYGGAVAAAFDSTWRAEWLNGFDYRVKGDADVAAWITANGFSGATAVVWSYDAWVYALADLQIVMPTPPIYNDEVLLGHGGPVEEYVANQRPELIIVDAVAQQLFPEIGKLLAGGEYVNKYVSYPDTVWVRADSAQTLP